MSLVESTSLQVANSESSPVGSSSRFWDDWLAQLADRQAPRPLRKQLPRGSQPLAWSGEPVCDLQRGPASWSASLFALPRKSAKKLAKRPERRAKQADGQWLEQLEQWVDWVAANGRVVPFEAVAWAHQLPELLHLLPAAPWTSLLDQLVRLAQDAVALDLTSTPVEAITLAGELPWTLAYHFPDVPRLRALGGTARERLSASITELTDGRGCLRARFQPVLRSCLASWLRAYALRQSDTMVGGGRGDGLDDGAACFDAAAESQFPAVVLQTLRQLGSDGVRAFAAEGEGPWPADLIAAMVHLADQADCRRAARAMHLVKGQHPKRSKLPSPATHSELGQFAILRTRWDDEAARLAVDYSAGLLRLTLAVDGRTILAGSGEPLVHIDGQSLASAGDWAEICWESDADMDYLELERQFTGGWKVQRQFVLARQAKWLYVADAILGLDPSAIEACSRFTLTPDFQLAPAAESHEAQIVGRRRPAANLLPLALPEWRSIGQDGQLIASGALVELRQRATAAACYVPLFIDLNRRRARRPFTWRRLTVGEQLQAVPRDRAVGYRVRTGDEQWMFYRALDGGANRSVLGQNFSSEFVAARFLPNGAVEKLVEILREPVQIGV